MADLNLNDDKKALEDIKKTVQEALTPVKTLADAVGLMVAASDQLNRNFGLARSRIIEMNVAFADSAANVQTLGGSLTDTVNVISDAAAASNRNVIENEKVIGELYASSKLLGTSTKELVDDFKNVGYETSQIGPNIGESISYIQGVGLNATKVMKSVSDNMEKMNRFQFEGGVAGLAKMAAQASMLRFDMSQTFSFADRMLSPENAINMASAFQRLGVTAGKLVDPFVLMNESINDPTGLQNSLARLGQEFTYFDEETKSFKINPQGVLTLRQMEEEAGLAAGSLSKSALAAADLDKRLEKVSGAGLTFKNEEDKQYLANIARMGEGGEYEVTLNDGTRKELQNLNQEQFDELIQQQKDAPKTVEDIQKSQLSFLERIAANGDAAISALKLGTVSVKDVTTNMEGLRNIVTKFTDVSQKTLPKAPEVRKSVGNTIEAMKELFAESQKEGGMTSKGFVSKLENFEENFLKKGKNLTDESYNAVQKVLKETASNVKGNSDIEKWFRSSVLSTPEKSKISTQTKMGSKKANMVKPLSRTDIIGSKGVSNVSDSLTKTKEINSQVDFGGTITIKVDSPPGVSEKYFKEFFESDEFKRKIYEYYNQKAKDAKGSYA